MTVKDFMVFTFDDVSASEIAKFVNKNSGSTFFGEFYDEYNCHVLLSLKGELDMNRLDEVALNVLKDLFG